MRRRNGYDRKQAAKKERAIMLVSSAFVLTALTLTGFYVKENNKKEQFDGYTVDFSSLENNVNNKYNEITQDTQELGEDSDLLSGLQSVDSGDVEIPGLTDKINQALDETEVKPQLDAMESNPDIIGDVELAEGADFIIEDPVLAAETEIPTEEAPVVETHPALLFEEKQGLAWPVSGEIIIDYSMDKTTYFPTLDQYKCSSAVVISSEEGKSVCASASGKVIDVYKDAEIGNAVTMDLGNGYHLTYGQLENITVSVGSYVDAGDSFATIAKPTKYYSVEGANLYFKLVKDNAPMNPLTLMTDY